MDRDIELDNIKLVLDQLEYEYSDRDIYSDCIKTTKDIADKASTIEKSLDHILKGKIPSENGKDSILESSIKHSKYIISTDNTKFIPLEMIMHRVLYYNAPDENDEILKIRPDMLKDMLRLLGYDKWKSSNKLDIEYMQYYLDKYGIRTDNISREYIII